jgi:protein-S-isoprenylcysteine O-methyltransferase Ste14
LDYFSLYAALYLIGFAALHSLLAGLPAKKMARRHFGPKVDPWYPVLFSAIAIVTILPLVIMLIRDPGRVIYVVPHPWIWLFFLAQLLMGIATMRAFLDAPHRFLIRAQLAQPLSPDAFAIGIKGIYCWIRDPFLLSGLILIWLTPIMTENLLLVYLIASVYLFLGSLHWESRLLIQFGDDYVAYQNEVARMIPRRNKKWHDCRGIKNGIKSGKK